MRWIVGIAAAIFVVGVLAYAAYAGYEFSRQSILAEGHHSPDCRNPMSRFGWPYEAINYPIADDARLEADNATRRKCSSQGVGAGDEVVTSDGVPIAGWYIPAADGSGPEDATVVVVHGFSSNKSGELAYIGGLHEHFNIVAFDQRNGGRSGGTQTTLGVLEQNDVRAMVDWVERVKHPDHVGLYGVSQGAAAALAEATGDPRIEAIALDSMHTTIGHQFEQQLIIRGHPPYPGTWATFIADWLRTGLWMSAVDPEDTITRLGDIPILMVHGTGDRQDLPERTQAFYDDAVAAGRDVELHWCEGADHAEVDKRCADDLARWLDDFFTRTLVDGSP